VKELSDKRQHELEDVKRQLEELHKQGHSEAEERDTLKTLVNELQLGHDSAKSDSQKGKAEIDMLKAQLHETRIAAERGAKQVQLLEASAEEEAKESNSKIASLQRKMDELEAESLEAQLMMSHEQLTLRHEAEKAKQEVCKCKKTLRILKRLRSQKTANLNSYVLLWIKTKIKFKS